MTVRAPHIYLCLLFLRLLLCVLPLCLGQLQWLSHSTLEPHYQSFQLQYCTFIHHHLILANFNFFFHQKTHLP